MHQIERYDGAHELQKKYVADLLDEFNDEITQMHGKCIDIGCGPGSTTAKLILPKLPLDARLVGTDIMKSAIEWAQARYSDEKRLTFIELDIVMEELPQHLIGAFDNAISTFCIHWCPEPSRAFKNIYDLLRPRGKALILFVIEDERTNIYSKLYDYPEYQPYMKDFVNYIPYLQYHANPRAATKKMLEEAGFRVLHCSSREAGYIFKNREKAVEHMLIVNPFSTRMPENLQKKFEADILQELLKLPENAYYVNIKNGANESTVDQPTMFKFKLLITYFEKPV